MARRAGEAVLGRVAALAALILLAGPVGSAAELKPETVRAFERYVKAAESQMEPRLADPAGFLWIETVPPADRRRAIEALQRGQFLIERIRTDEGGEAIDVPDGLVHHWLGTVWIPHATLSDALALLQDYDRHDEVYAPAVAGSRLLSRDGDAFTVYLRFFFKKVITVVVNSEHEARFTRPAPDRAYSRIVSTRIAEVEDPGTDREREKPVGQDGGYLWRLNSYWRFLEKDDGTYVECETISLTRGIPFGLRWIIGPFVTSIPRESLAFTLETTRRVLATDTQP